MCVCVCHEMSALIVWLALSPPRTHASAFAALRPPGGQGLWLVAQLNNEPLWFKLALVLLTVLVTVVTLVCIGLLLAPDMTISAVQQVGAATSVHPKIIDNLGMKLEKLAGRGAPPAAPEGIAAFDRAIEAGM